MKNTGDRTYEQNTFALETLALRQLFVYPIRCTSRARLNSSPLQQNAEVPPSGEET